MTTTNNINVVFVGNHITIGKTKDGTMYFLPHHFPDRTLWFRFDKDYYSDYQEYLNDYNEHNNNVEDFKHGSVYD